MVSHVWMVCDDGVLTSTALASSNRALCKPAEVLQELAPHPPTPPPILTLTDTHAGAIFFQGGWQNEFLAMPRREGGRGGGCAPPRPLPVHKTIKILRAHVSFEGGGGPDPSHTSLNMAFAPHWSTMASSATGFLQL